MDTGFHIYRRNLPHWRQTGRTYFVTWRVKPGVAELSDPERHMVADCLRFRHGQKYWLHAFVVMNDHVHVLVTPIGEIPLEDLVREWKSYPAHQFSKLGTHKGGVWQVDYFDRIVRDQDEFLEKARYILNNPAKRWPGLDGYRWVGTESELIVGACGDARPH
jgi:REP element-mobilizing transposase RayT